ncbi:MAG: carboxypeptidase-like regulatory domain-containing protein [archaeon]
MITEKLAEIYTKAEDKYFDALDFLDSKGLPVYAYSDFFENKGVPSFVVTIAIIVAILILLTVVLTYRGGDISELSISLKDSQGNSLTNVDLLIKDGKDNILFEGIRSDGEKIILNRALYSGEKINILASLEGYQPKTLEFTVGVGVIPRISFQQNVEGIEAKIRLIDSETKTIVRGATIIASSNDLSYSFDEDTNGVYIKSIPSATAFSLKVTAEGYNEYVQTMTFNSGEINQVELTPSTQSYVGKATLALSVVDADGKSIDDATVKIYEKAKDLPVLSDFTRQGLIMGEVTAGVSLRVIVEKKGYLTYDSDKEGAGLTIREKEKSVTVILKQGGQKLTVSVVDASLGLTLDGAIVGIYGDNGVKYAESTSTISGAVFEGLDANGKIFVTASKEGYLAGRELVDIASTEEVKVMLQKVTATNSARLDIYALDKFGVNLNGVNINLIEIKDGNFLPSGLSGLVTSFAGYVPVVVESGKTYTIIGSTDVMQGSTIVEIKQGEVEKKVYINMEKKPNVVEMKFLDLFGKAIYGTAKVSGLDGTALYDGNISNSSIFFDSEQREVVEVQVTTEDGNLFTENVTVKGKDYVEVIVYNKEANALAPTIEFAGIENENGDEVKGITPGAFYFIKFNVAYPNAAQNGGVYFRVGADNVAFAESEKFAIFDLSMQNATINYSKSYSPTPVPGNEVVDRANVGAQGEKNKWVEATLSLPRGTNVVKVKVRAEDYSEGKVQLKYRAWASVQGEYYRTPEDLTLGIKQFTESKMGLYADILTQDLTLYESLPECTGNICVSTNFVDEDETFIKAEGFEALKNKIYGLEVELTSLESDYVQVKVSSDSNIDFTSTQTGNFNFVREDANAILGNKSASTAASLTKDGKQKLRFYFKGTENGAAKITITVTGQTELTKDVLFKVVQEKQLLVELSEKQVMAGKNFTVRVTDEGLKGVENALVKIIDKDGKVAKSMIGEATDGKGKNGYYRIQNDLSIGLYTVEVSLATYATQTVPLLISTQTVLTFPETFEAKIPLGQKSMILTGDLVNNSEFTVQNISVQTNNEVTSEQTVGESVSTTDAGKFKITTVVPPALSSGQKQSVQITIVYTGEANDSAEESATLDITGLLEGKFSTKVSSTITMSYNRKLDPSCLVIDPTSVTINLLGTAGSNDSEIVEVTNNCDQAVFLTKRAKKKGGDSYVIVGSDDIDLQQGETKNITITANNLIERANAREQTLGYEIAYDSNYLKKSVSVNVKIINPAFALSYPPQISLWMAQRSSTEPAVAAQPLFVTNISSFPVEGITFAVDKEYGNAGNIQLSVEPPGTVNLERGQTMPTKVVFAKSSSKLSEPVRGRITITGKMGQLNNRSAQNDRYDYYSNFNNGQNALANYNPNTSSSYYNNYTNTNQTLGLIDVIVYYSGYNCLKAYPVDSLEFSMPDEGGGQIARKIEVRNTCAEPIRLVTVTPAGQAKVQLQVIGVQQMMNPMIMAVPQVSIMPGMAMQIPLTVITPSSNIKRPNYPIVINGISEMSGTPVTSDTLKISVLSGRDLATEHVKAKTVDAVICDGGKGIETKILIPTISENANCGEAYCDATNAAKYISAKINQVIKNARSKGYDKKNLTETFGCETQGYCTFAQIGMQNESFDLYLQNDALSAQLLESEMNNVDVTASDSPFRETSGSGGYTVIQEIVDSTTITQRALAGYPKAIFLDRGIYGCGYYKIQLDGAFRANVDGLDAMNPIISVRALGDVSGARLKTGQCADSMQNIVNFNPIDKGLTPNQNLGAWVTTITSDTLLQDIAKKVSALRFKTDTRVASGNGNTIKFVQAGLSDSLAEVCLTGGERKTITVRIDESTVRSADKAAKAAFVDSIATMVADSLNGSFGKNCLKQDGANYTCVQLKNPSLGKRTLEIQSPTLAFGAGNEGCVQATVYSTIKEKLFFDVEPVLIEAKEFLGVKKITIKADDSKNVPSVLIKGTTATATDQTTTNTTTTQIPTKDPLIKSPATGNGTTPTTAATSTKPTNAQVSSTEEKVEVASFAGPQAPPNSITKFSEDGKLFYQYDVLGGNLESRASVNNQIDLQAWQTTQDYKYYRNIKICASTTSEENKPADAKNSVVQANGLKFQVGITPETNENPGEGAKKIITISTGTIHPYDLAVKITSGEIKTEKVYSFIPMWSDEDPQAIYWQKYVDALKRQGKLDKALTSGTETSSAQEEINKKGQTTAIEKYLLGCMITSAVCNSTGGMGSAAYNAIMDCSVPIVTVKGLRDAATASSAGRTIMQGIETAINAVTGVVNLFLNAIQIGKVIGNIPKVSFFSTEPAVIQDYSATEIQAKAIGVGGATGFLATPFRPTIWTRFASGVNPTNIDKWADDMAKMYAEQATKSIEDSVDWTKITTPGRADQLKANIKNFIDTTYTPKVKEGFAKGLKDKYADMWERTVNRPVFSTKYIGKDVTGKIYGGVDTSLETNIDAVMKDMISKGDTGFTKYLDTPVAVAGSTTPTTVKMESIFGDADEMKKLFKDGTPMKDILKAKLSISPGVLDEKITAALTNGGYVKDGMLNTTVNSADDLSGVIGKSIDEILPGLDPAKRASMISTAKSSINTSSYVTSEEASKTFSAGRAGMYQIGENPAVKGTPVGKLVEDIKTSLQAPIAAELKSSGRIEATAKEIKTAISGVIDGKAVEASGKIDKTATLAQKFKSLLSARALGVMAWGAGCGMLANAVGTEAFDSTMSDTAKQLGLDTYKMSDTIITAGQKYVITIDPLKNPLIRKIESTDIVKPENILTSTANAENDNKTPEERPLGVYPLVTSKTKLMDAIKTKGEMYNAYYSKDSSQFEKIDGPVLRYMFADLQNVVSRNTGAIGFNCKTNTKQIKINNWAYPGGESLAFTIATTQLGRKEYSSDMIQAESKDKGTWLHDKLVIAFTALEKAPVKKVNADIVKQMFPKANTDEINRFLDDLGTWDYAFEQSPAQAKSVCPDQLN